MFEFIRHSKHHHLFLRNTWAPLHIIFGSNLKDISQCPFASIILHNIAHTHLCDESSIDLVERSLKECCHFDVNGRDNRRTQNEEPTAWAKTETSPWNGITGSTMTSTNENELADFSCLSQAVGIKLANKRIGGFLVLGAAVGIKFENKGIVSCGNYSSIHLQLIVCVYCAWHSGKHKHHGCTAQCRGCEWLAI